MKPKAFKTLKAKWDKKLAKSGFQDIEQEDENLKMWAARPFRDIEPVQAEAVAEYYRLAGHFFHEYKFESDLERDIWEMHSQGMPLRTIAALLKIKKVKINKDKVNMVVRDLKAKMLELYR